MSTITNWSTTPASNNSAPPDGASENWAPSAVNNVIRQNMAEVAKWFQDTNGSLDSTGSANAYLLTTNQSEAAYAADQVYVFKANFGNTAAATINVDSLGVKSIVKHASTALESGDIASGAIIKIIYDGTNFIAVSGLNDATSSLAASAVVVTPAGNISSTDAQAALEELDAEIIALQALHTDPDFNLQEVFEEDGAFASGTTTIPFDDTIPQNTEGTEFMTKAITPKSSNSIITVEAIVNAGNSGSAQITAALFIDTTADGIVATSTLVGTGNTQVVNLKLKAKYTNSNTTAKTFKLRIGGDAGTTYFNGSAGARKFGGAFISSISLTETSQ